MENETTSEVIEITLEAKIENELVKANVTQAVIATLKQKYSGMKLSSLTNKEEYLEIRAAAKECSKIRNLAVKCCKELRQDAIRYQKQVVEKEKEIVAQIGEVETPLDEEIAKFDAEVERLANEEKRLQEEAYMHRTQALTKMGALYSEGAFTLGAYSIEANMIKESSLETWTDSILPKFDAEYQKLEAERIELQKKKDIEESELKRKQKELEEEQRKFQQEQAEFKRQQDEEKRLNLEKEQAERFEKNRIANELQNKRMQLIMPYNPFNLHEKGIDVNALHLLTESDFISLLETAKVSNENERAEKQKQIEEQAAAKERQRIQEENRQAEIKRQQEEQRKAEELAKAGDTAQWDNFIEQVKKITVPNVKSGQYRKIVLVAKENIDKILNLKP